MNPSDRLGARLGPSGCSFRVWAPHAERVRVLIQNGPYWEDTDTIVRQDLTQDGEYWTGAVPGVQAWQLYRYEITHSGNRVLERLDPAARDVLSSELTRRDPLNKVRGFLGWEGYDHSWNLVKYTLGSHDDCGDLNNGNAEDGRTNWDKRHRYLIDQLGGRDDWHARAKCRLAWALNVAMPGTPMLLMGTECNMASPHVGWGYWHDGTDENGDHRFNWHIAGDITGMEMRRLVAACNAVRWNNAALRAESLSVPHHDPENQVMGFTREGDGNLILTVVNLSDRTFTDHCYGVATGHGGQWSQILCTQDASFGGWDGAGNAFHEPWTQSDGKVYVNLPMWSVVMLRRK